MPVNLALLTGVAGFGRAEWGRRRRGWGDREVGEWGGGMGRGRREEGGFKGWIGRGWVGAWDGEEGW